MATVETTAVCCQPCERQAKRVVLFERHGDVLMFHTRNHQFTITTSQLLAVCRRCGSLICLRVMLSARARS